MPYQRPLPARLPQAGQCRPLNRWPVLSSRPAASIGSPAPHLQRRTGRRNTVAFSLFGVGAPEAVLVGVVALVVFGPQGLIDAAKAAAATIRSFQPAIQEINQASTEIRSTITNEMGIDKLQQEFREVSQATRDSLSLNPTLPTATTAANQDTTTADAKQVGGAVKQESKVESPTTIPQELETFEAQAARAQSNNPQQVEEDIEKMRADSAALAWGGTVPKPQDTSPSQSGPKRLEEMSMAELERELERRKKLIKAIEDLNG